MLEITVEAIQTVRMVGSCGEPHAVVVNLLLKAPMENCRMILPMGAAETLLECLANRLGKELGRK